MQKVSKHTKFKIIGGYITLFLLSFVSIILIYKQITKLNVEEPGVSETNQKLFLTGNTITGLYEAEALSNAFVQTGSRTYFRKYLDIIEEVKGNIDSLKNLTTDSIQQSRIDSIGILLEEKVQNLQALVRVKQSLTPDDFYSKAIASIESGRDSVADTPNIRTRVIKTLDSTYVKSEKKKGWWLFAKTKPDSVLQVTMSEHTIIDSLNTDMPLQNTDTVINILKSVWQEMQEQSQNINRQINRREYELINKSTHITDQLKSVLEAYEKEEINHSLARISKREKVVNTTTQIIAWIAIAAFLLILFFIFFILRDLSRSQRYRRELETANQYAGQLLKSREKMILTVTHDIKSPLSSIMGYIELLRNMPLNERERYFLKNMQGSSEHILHLVTNLLDYSKLENNKMPVEEILYNPGQLFQEIYDNFMPLAAKKKLELQCKIGQDLNKEYRGDALRIRQIITNIFSNAIKYTQQGYINFSVVSSTSDEEMIIRIKDSGPGMTQEEQELIFQEFTRLSSHSGVEGTGLGLTITLKLIQLLGGKMKLESTPGQGSCFTIILPLHKSEKQAEITQQEEKKTSPAISGQLKILLVDDDPLQLEMTSGLLQSQGIASDTTTKPGTVTGLLLSGQYNLVMTDIQMPETDGFELVKQIRDMQNQTLRNIPVIALSANSEKKENDYLEAGFTAYLGKPFTSGDLLKLLSQLTGISCNTIIPEKQTEESSVSANGYTLKNILLFADNDKNAIRKILESFCTETQKNLKLLEQYKTERQNEQLAKVAHKMLPLFRQLEASQITELLQKLERLPENTLPPEEIQRITDQATSGIKKIIDEISTQ